MLAPRRAVRRGSSCERTQSGCRVRTIEDKDEATRFGNSVTGVDVHGSCFCKELGEEARLQGFEKSGGEKAKQSGQFWGIELAGSRSEIWKGGR